MSRRRGFAAIITPIMGILALVAGIALIVGLVTAIGQALMSRISGSFGSGSFGGSYETTSVLDGLPIETSGKIAIEDHLALSAGATDLEQHFAATGVDTNFPNAADQRKIKTMYNELLRAGKTSSFISELNGQVPAEDEAWYVNQRWCYDSRCFKGQAIGAKEQYLRKRVVITNPKNGRSVVASVLDWGPGTTPGERERVGGISPEIATALNVETNDSLIFGWAVDQNVPLGPVKVSATGSSSGSNGSGYTTTSRGFPRFLQYEGPWAQLRYGNCPPTYQAGQGNHKYTEGTFADAACGPTSLANVLKYYQQKGQLVVKSGFSAKYGSTINPQTVAGIILTYDSKLRVCGNGTDPSFIEKIGETYFNLRVSSDVSWDSVKDALRQNTPVIALMGSGVFTDSGHYVVLYGINEDAGVVYSSDSYTRNVQEASFDNVSRQKKSFYIINTQ